MSGPALDLRGPAHEVPPVSRAGTLAGVRLAIVTDTYQPQVNGVTRTLARLADEATARGGDVEVHTASDPGASPMPDVLRYPSTPFWAYPQMRLAAPPFGGLARRLARFGPSLVHIATPFGLGLAGRRAADRLGVPWVSSYHTHFTAYAEHYHLGALASVGWRYLRWFHNGGRRTYCPSRAVADEITAHGFRRVDVWGRGVDAEMFSPAFRSLELRRSLGIRDHELVVAYVGRLAREKGIDDLLGAGHRLCAGPSTPAVRLLVVGEGPYMSACMTRADGSAVFTGRQAGMALSRLYASADLFVMPSITETFGNVTLEAMASGVPVIAADCAVTRELLPAAAGVCYAAGDVEGLAEAILRLARDPAARRAMGLAGRAAALARSWTAIFGALFADYRRVLAGRPPGGA